MNLLITEAFIVGLKEALKLGAVWIVFLSFLDQAGRKNLLKFFGIGLMCTTGLFGASFFVPAGPESRQLLSTLTGYVFFLFFMASLAVLFSGGPGPLRRFSGGSAPGSLVLAGTVCYFAPDIIGSSLFVRELSLMRETYVGGYLSASAGFVLVLVALFLVFRNRTIPLGRHFGLGQLLLFLALVKFLGGGVRGFAELSLIPAVQRGVMKFVHDVIHQTFVILMMPDHPLLRVTLWDFIGVFFGSNIAMFIALFLLVGPPLAFLYESYTSPVLAPQDMATGAERRKYRAKIMLHRIHRGLPVAAFVVIVMVSWFAGRGEQSATLYLPEPKPVVADKGRVIIPLTDPTMDLMDGNLHKFSLLRDGKTITLLVIKRPDGKLAAGLDACEICPPEGYGLSGENVVCVYCRTPIPVDTLGRAGGCNPIPLAVEITEGDIRIDAGEIEKKWLKVITGETKEGIR
jgi:uncharacterized membrane protein